MILFPASTGKCSTFCLLALAGAASLHADLSGMAAAFVIVSAVRGLTVDTACRRCRSCYIAVGISFTLLKAVTAGFLCSFRLISSDADSVKVAVKVLVMQSCLHTAS